MQDFRTARYFKRHMITYVSVCNDAPQAHATTHALAIKTEQHVPYLNTRHFRRGASDHHFYFERRRNFQGLQFLRRGRCRLYTQERARTPITITRARLYGRKSQGNRTLTEAWGEKHLPRLHVRPARPSDRRKSAIINLQDRQIQGTIRANDTCAEVLTASRLQLQHATLPPNW